MEYAEKCNTWEREVKMTEIKVLAMIPDSVAQY